jgi:hypothetical protein
VRRLRVYEPTTRREDGRGSVSYSAARRFTSPARCASAISSNRCWRVIPFSRGPVALPSGGALALPCHERGKSGAAEARSQEQLFDGLMRGNTHRCAATARNHPDRSCMWFESGGSAPAFPVALVKRDGGPR